MTPSLLLAFGLAVTIPAGAIGCGAALVVERLTPSHRLREAAWRCATTAIVAAALVGPAFVIAAPIPPAPISLISPATTAAASPASSRTLRPGLNWAKVEAPLSETLLVLSGAGTLLALASLALGLHRMGRVTGRAKLLTDPASEGQMRIWAARLKVAQPRVLVSPEAPTAFVVGPPAPRIVIPEALLASASLQSLGLVCAHELAHLKRGDPGRVLVDRLITAALWFNPFVHLAVSRLAAAREMACDDMVLRDATPQVRRLYAETLLAALQLVGRTTLNPALIRPQGDHMMRLDAVLHPSLPQRRGKTVLLTILLTLGVGSAVGVVAAAAGELQAVSRQDAKPPVSKSTRTSEVTIAADSVTENRGHIIYDGSPSVRTTPGEGVRVKVDGRFVTGDIDYRSAQVAHVEVWPRWRPDVAEHGGDAQHDVVEVTLVH